MLVLYFLLLIGAHSHIRGLGLDDALEARQVRRMFFFPCFNCEYRNVRVHVQFVNCLHEPKTVMPNKFGITIFLSLNCMYNKL